MCIFPDLKYLEKCLGHIASGGIIAVDTAIICAIIDWPEPTCIKHLNYLLV